MKGDFEAGEYRAAITIPVPGADGRPDHEAAVSLAAYRLHVYATVAAETDGHPGFVSDGYLDAVAVNASIAAAELVRVGLWAREPAGYRVLDAQTVEFAGAATRWADRVEAHCINGLGHVEDPGNPGHCEACHGPMPAAGGATTAS
jgi:hypothetical protein